MALTYGTEGIKQKDYRVYLAAYSTIGLNEVNTGKMTLYNAAKSQATLETALGLMTELGECRADSINVTAENGDTVEGNVLGEIVLNKACSMVAELINATPENINALAALDGKPLTVVILEKDTHAIAGSAIAKTAIVINNIVMSYSENITGGDSIRSTVNLSRNVPTVGDFRSIADLTWTLQEVLMALSYGTKGLKQKSWRVYIAPADTVGLDDGLDLIDAGGGTAPVDDAIDLMSEYGECRDDSIVVTGEDGDSIEGNVTGNIVLNKSCTMSAELINFTPDNISALENLDGTEVSVLLVEKDSHLVDTTYYKTVIIIRHKNMSYSENITGGDTGKAMITVSDTPNKIGKFRTIYDCEVK